MQLERNERSYGLSAAAEPCFNTGSIMQLRCEPSKINFFIIAHKATRACLLFHLPQEVTPTQCSNVSGGKSINFRRVQYEISKEVLYALQFCGDASKQLFLVLVTLCCTSKVVIFSYSSSNTSMQTSMVNAQMMPRVESRWTSIKQVSVYCVLISMVSIYVYICSEINSFIHRDFRFHQWQ